LKVDGSIVAWGYNAEGQCDVPSPNTGFADIAGGGFHSQARLPIPDCDINDDGYVDSSDMFILQNYWHTGAKPETPYGN